jgi:hypothetical protein
MFKNYQKKEMRKQSNKNNENPWKHNCSLNHDKFENQSINQSHARGLV